MRTWGRWRKLEVFNFRNCPNPCRLLAAVDGASCAFASSDNSLRLVVVVETRAGGDVRVCVMKAGRERGGKGGGGETRWRGGGGGCCVIDDDLGGGKSFLLSVVVYPR